VARIFRRRKPNGKWIKTWYAWVPDLETGGTRKVTTNCTDPVAAQKRADQLERDAVDPDSAAAAKATVRDAIGLLLRDRASEVAGGNMSEHTVDFYQRKGGVLLDALPDILGRAKDAPIYLREVGGALVDDYIGQRRKDGAGENSISKELTTWRAAMRIAKRRRLWRGDIDECFPKGFSSKYIPGTRWLTPAELVALLREMVRVVPVRQSGLDASQIAAMREMRLAGKTRPELAKVFGISVASVGRLTRERGEPEPRAVQGHHLFAIVAFAIATGAEPSAIWRARRGDAATDYATALVRGSKNEYRKNRTVTLPLLPFRFLLAYAVQHAIGDPMLFPKSQEGNFRRTLGDACKRAGIEPVCLTDLRRTHGKWLRLSGVSPDNIGTNLGHADGRMAERVYGKSSPEELARVIEAQVALTGGLHMVLAPVETVSDRSNESVITPQKDG
jgi:hypothetical protein